MADEMRTVLTTRTLRKEPRALSDEVVSPGGDVLQVHAGESVKLGANPSQDEITDTRKTTWVFVQAIGGLFVDLRKGYVPDDTLVATTVHVDASPGFIAFSEQMDKANFANECRVQVDLSNIDPVYSAYLYALAFALSGDKWNDTQVQTGDHAGVFRFPTETWQLLISEPETGNIQTEDIKFPEVQCVVAAILVAKAVDLLKSVTTGHGLTFGHLSFAHLFANDNSLGSNATAVILKAEQTQPSETVVKGIYPDSDVRAAFFKRNADIFTEDGSATIENALKACAAKLDLGFAEAKKLDKQGRCQSEVFGNSIPSSSTALIFNGVGSGSLADAGVDNRASGSSGGEASPGATVAGIKGGIDRRQFAHELENPVIVKKLADMVKGEVGWKAPPDTKLVQLETPFNRAMARGHSLAQALWSTSEAGIRGYYQGGRNGTYSRPVTPAEFTDFKQNILPKLLAGSNRSEELFGFIATGNASPPTSTEQKRRGTPSGDLETEVPNHPESYFFEGPFRRPFIRLLGRESIPIPSERSSSAEVALSDAGEPPEHMEGDTEGHGPSGGKFNVPTNTPIAPQSEHQTITLTNGEKVTVNNAVAGQFLGFFNDLIKFRAPVRGLGGFGMRGNPSEHPIGYAVDWAQVSRDVVAGDVRTWIDNNRGTLKKLELRWGLSGGENWHNPDTGHFSVERILGEQHLKASAKASEND